MARHLKALTEMRASLSPQLQAKFTPKGVVELTASLEDGSIFEIVRELEEIQQLSERSFLSRRIEVVNNHKRQKADLSRRHKQELDQSQPVDDSLIKAQQEKETSDLEERLEKEVSLTDQKIILELDQMVTDQQTTLRHAAVPYFLVSNDPIDIQLQCNVLQFIQRLAPTYLE